MRVQWTRRSLIRAACGAVAVAATSAHAQPDYDFNWATIGDPGNRGTNAEEAPDNSVTFGAVDHKYRMATTEVTTNQWIEFINVYAQYYEGRLSDLELTGAAIYHDFSTGDFGIFPRFEGAANLVSWRMSARYVNWLHNDKRSDQAAFENGAYDTSTFGFDQNGFFTDQVTRSPGTRFWIPSMDEWTKAMHWDPAKNSGEGGYWFYPTSSDTPPIYGLPELGGQSNGGTDTPLPVGSYPGITSPWGLLDGSGGESEFTERVSSSGAFRKSAGSSWLGGDPADIDQLGHWTSSVVIGPGGALRIASAVPAPGPAGLVVFGSILILGQRRRSSRG